MQIEFAAYAGDCRVTGRLNLEGDRLSDMLDRQSVLTIADATLESLDDGRIVQLPEVTLDRDELFVVEATGPRGPVARRIHTVRHRLQIQVGPYAILGYLHARPGSPPLMVVGRRGPMVPMTDATIAYMSGGCLQLHDAETLIINRGLADWVRAEPDDMALVSGVGLAHLLVPGSSPA